ncbi:MAG: PASTA domain-containing protein [Gemmatimonadaceae bacterium]
MTAPPASVPISVSPRPVPDVRALSLREAVRALHRAGFQVRITEGPPATVPAAGTVAGPGTIVQLSRPRG